MEGAGGADGVEGVAAIPRVIAGVAKRREKVLVVGGGPWPAPLDPYRGGRN